VVYYLFIWHPLILSDSSLSSRPSRFTLKTKAACRIVSRDHKPNAHRRPRRVLPVGSRDPVYNFLCCWWQVTTQLRHCWKSYQYRSKLSYSNRYGVCLVSFTILLIESVGSRRELYCELCSHRRRRRNSSRQLSRVGVCGVYWAVVEHWPNVAKNAVGKITDRRHIRCGYRVILSWITSVRRYAIFRNSQWMSLPPTSLASLSFHHLSCLPFPLLFLPRPSLNQVMESV